jgi:thiosulfate/3-mercaptopyruvate sulfurtransferase
MREPKALISTAQLASALGQSDLRIYDCTTYLEPTPAGSEDPYIAVSGIRTFEEAHIPGADFLDLQGEFSDPATRLRFMMPETAQLEAAFGRHGINGGARVVLYSIGSMMWATRFWWMLRSLGFDGAAVLDGGFDKWKAEGLPLESGRAKSYPPTKFNAMRRSGFFTDRNAVVAAFEDPSTVIVNALGPQFHKGLEPSRYGRPGRVPGSVNVPRSNARGRENERLHDAWRRSREVRGAGRDEGSKRDLLLRRRHLGHHRSLLAAPARLRQPFALRRFHGGMGEG